MKLTPLQIRTLMAIDKGSVSMGNAGYAAFRIRGANPSVVGKLVSAGLAKWPKGPVEEQVCGMTELGARQLAELQPLDDEDIPF